MKVILYIVLFISTLSPAPAVIVGRGTKNMLWYYALTSLIFDMAGTTLVFCSINPDILYNLFILLQFLLVSIHFWNLNIFMKKHRTIYFVIVILLSIYFIIRTCLGSWLHLNFEDASLFYFVFIILSICGLYKVIYDIPVIRIEHSPVFIFSAAFLLYATGSIILLKVKDPMQETDPGLLRNFWVMHNVLNVLKNISIAYCLYLYKPKTIEPG